MSESDPQIIKDWSARRHEMAHAGLKRLVALVAADETERAAGPLPLHKDIYIDPVRFEAEREKLFLGQPIVAGLSGDIPNSGDLLVFDAAGQAVGYRVAGVDRANNKVTFSNNSSLATEVLIGKIKQFRMEVSLSGDGRSVGMMVHAGGNFRSANREKLEKQVAGLQGGAGAAPW